MIRHLATLALTTAATVALTAGPSTADDSHTERVTRKADRIPASVVYLHGSAEWIDTDVRCFTGWASKTIRLQGVKVRRGQLVGYCNDGFIARTNTDGHAYREIHPGTTVR